MPKTTTFANNSLKLILNATAIANIADNASASPLTNLYVSLHSSSPGVGGTQLTNEAAYTGYLRVAVARTTGGWSAASGGVSSPVAAITFPAGSGGGETVTYMGIGSVALASGAGVLYYFGTVTPNITTGNGVTPQLTTGTTITET